MATQKEDQNSVSKIVSEYHQEIPQSQTTDNPVAPRGRAAQPSRDTRKTNQAKDRISLNAGQKYCRMLQGEHSAILSSFIKLSFVIKIFVLSSFEWPLKTGFTVFHVQCSGSVVECLTPDRRAAGSSLTGVPVLCP